jgi:hypothetical protein
MYHCHFILRFEISLYHGHGYYKVMVQSCYFPGAALESINDTIELIKLTQHTE